MMKKLKERKGFTMAELLIVVAIVAVLVAVSIPVFSSQLEKSRDAVSTANIRAAYAQASADYLTGKESENPKVQGVVLKGTQNGWSGLDSELPFTHTKMDEATGGAAGTYELEFSFGTDGSCTLEGLTKKK